MQIRFKLDASPSPFRHPLAQQMATSESVRFHVSRFGLALAQWLSQQGAKKLLLTSKRGLRTGAQAKVIEQMRATGTQVTKPSQVPNGRFL